MTWSFSSLPVSVAVICGACVHGGFAAANCRSDVPGNYGASIEVHADAGALDLDDSIVIKAKPPSPGRVTHMDLIVNGTRYTLPQSNRDTVELSVEQMPGSRALSLAGIPLHSGDVLEVNVFDTEQHCGYATLSNNGVQVRAASDDFAIVIGVNKTRASSRELKHARDDAYWIANHLIKDVKLKPTNVWLLTDSRTEAVAAVPGASALQIEDPDSINTAFRAVGESISYLSALYVYFSGHQFILETHTPKVEHFFFMLPKSTVDEGSVSRWPWKTLTDTLTDFTHLDHGVVIVDSCYSGGPETIRVYADHPSGDAPDGMKVLSVPHRTHLQRAALPANVGLLASSDQNHPSWELKDEPHGAFTQALVDVVEAARGKTTLSLIEAMDGKPPVAGARALTADYVRREYGADAVQNPTHTGDTDWMREPGTWLR